MLFEFLPCLLSEWSTTSPTMYALKIYLMIYIFRIVYVMAYWMSIICPMLNIQNQHAQKWIRHFPLTHAHLLMFPILERAPPPKPEICFYPSYLLLSVLTLSSYPISHFNLPKYFCLLTDNQFSLDFDNNPLIYFHLVLH